MVVFSVGTVCDVRHPIAARKTATFNRSVKCETEIHNNERNGKVRLNKLLFFSRLIFLE